MEYGFLLAEDEAMKAKLSTLTVPSPKEESGQKKVKVWYGMPSGERERTFPFITIDLLDITFTADRAHDLGVVAVDWWPSSAVTYQEHNDRVTPGTTLDAEAPYAITTRFQPYDIFYQVSTHCRTAVQDRYLTARLLDTAYFPLSNLGTLHVPADGTQRWADNEGWARADYLDQDEKAVWRKAYTIKISAHMAPTDPLAYQRVLQVATEISGMTDGELYATAVTDA
jgi:hypothetical protein